MRDFYQKHPRTSIFISYIIFAVIIFLPVIILINKNIAIDLGTFPSNAYFFETINSIQNNFYNQNFILITYKLLNPLTIGYFLHLIFQEPLAFNIFAVMQFIFGAFGGYLLLVYLFKEKAIYATLIGGILIGVLSFLFYPITLIAYLLLFFLRFLEKPNLRNGLLSLLFYFFLVSYNLFFSITTLLLILLLVLWKTLPIIRRLLEKKNIHNLYKIVTLILLFILIFVGKYYLPLRDIKPFALNNPIYNVQSLDVTYIAEIIKNLDIFSVIAFLLIIPFLIIIFFSIFAIKSYKINKWIPASLLFSFLFFIFALGPFLKIFNNYDPQISLPYLYLYYYFPYFNQTIDISYFIAFSLLFLIIFVSFGLKTFFKEMKSLQKIKPIFAGSLILLLIITLWVFWQPGTESRQLISGDTNKILYLSSGTQNNTNIFYENLSNNPIISRSIFKDNFENRNIIKKTHTSSLFINSVLDGQDINQANFIEPDFSTTFSEYLKKENIKHIVINYNFLKKIQPLKVKTGLSFENKKLQELLNFKKLVKFLKNNTDGKWEIKGENLIYQISNIEAGPILIHQGKNWGEPIIEDSAKERWAVSNAELIIDNTSSRNIDAELFFKTKTNKDLRKLKIYLNDDLKSEFVIGPRIKSHVASISNVEPGKNTIRLQITDYLDKELNIEERNKKESIQFSNINIKKVNNPEALKFYKDLELDNESKILMLPDINRVENNNFINFTDLINEKKEIKIPPLLEHLYFRDFGLTKKLDIYDNDYYYLSGQEEINKYNIRYLGIYKKWFDESEFADLMKFIINNFEIEEVPVNNDDMVLLKLVQKDPQKQITLDFIGNWGLIRQEDKLHKFYNIAFDGASLRINNPENEETDANLQFTVTNLEEKRTVKVYLSDNWLPETELDPINIPAKKTKTYNLEIKDLKPGENYITLKILDENNNELVQQKENGLRMSQFKIEKIDTPITSKTTQIDYCNEMFWPVLGHSPSSQEYQDSFEDESYTRKNSNLSWEMFFTEKEKYRGRQSLKSLTQAGQFSKKFNSCFNKVTASIMVKPKKWKYAELNFDFTNENLLDIRNYTPMTPGNNLSLLTPKKGVYLNSEGEREDFKHNINLNQWNKLEVTWEKEGRLKFYENGKLILEKDDYYPLTPSGIKAEVRGGKLKENINLYFDDFKLNFE